MSSWQCVLASGSPRRFELLLQIGVKPQQVIAPSVDESPLPDELPHVLVERLAMAKCDTVKKAVDPGDMMALVAADTVVVAGGRCLGKPRSYVDFVETMQVLSGRIHSVWTGVCVSGHQGGEWKTALTSVETRVRMTRSQEKHWRAYWASKEPLDKAGGYGIQGYGALLVESIEGSYSNIVGLPLRETANLLCEVGWDIWSTNLLANA